MLTRRIATFLLGGWLGCALLMGALVLSGPGSSVESLGSLGNAGSEIVEQVGTTTASDLMQYQTWEQIRRQWRAWEETQFLLAGILLVCFLFSSRGRIPGLLLTGGMVLILGFQYIAVFPDLSLRSRAADFAVAGSEATGQATSLLQLYGALETLKLLIGGVLASYLFVAESSTRGKRVRKRSRKRESDLEVPLEIR